MKTKKSLRVLQVNVDDLGFGGVFSFVMNINRHMDDHIIFDFCAIEKFQYQQNINKIKELNGKYWYIGYEGNKIIRQFKNFINIFHFLKTHPYNIVHIHSDVAFKLFNYSFAAKLAGVKNIILHSHSTGIDGKNRYIKYIAHLFFRKFLKKTGNYFYACSELAGKWMFKKNVPYIVIKNGIELEKFKFDKNIREQKRKELRLCDKIVVGNVGRFAYSKNHEFLIDIFEAFLKKRPESILLLVGNGDLEDAIKRKVKQKKLLDRVIFYGATSEINVILQTMDIFVFPSRFEGLGIAAIEAQAVGIPVIVSTEVPEEAVVADNMERVPLECSAGHWAEVIENYLGKWNHQQATVDLQHSGYDIVQVTADLEALYLGMDGEKI